MYDYKVIRFGNEISINLKAMGVQLKTKLQHTETRSAPAWSSQILCYLPAAFPHHLHLTELSFQQRNFGARLKSIISMY